ncbi:glutamate-cysteine ligase catalytic subunit [Thecamonas trahens ATCC 50062]|uniref:Glutamate--cysteine ligase n=1 Tax=Thecamonas trahens ATCC 50062 TaxID=461836 RepID=A0A0L0DIW4_THETB|nr:glutamate-cysteine ligase catalytic subunit [Thecamonas trahens ATCC 50062]KNC52334.1 glutamate-cysteine ligase catalytic subunit [Thecamonas trahens ATCC 50062]|eukprot:XP_013755384.1 glutamate-cysteine ligase catalytic subunit [Thecamonas trahens ATCC 50062]
MGLLTVGRPLSWDESRRYREYVRQHGVIQFLNLYKRLMEEPRDDCLLWGDEIEGMVIEFDHDARRVRLALVAEDVIEAANAEADPADAIFHPEYGSYMVETTPGTPYAATYAALLSVEANMAARRALVANQLAPNQAYFTLGGFPRLGCDDFTSPAHAPGGPIAKSQYSPDEAINSHPRFGALTAAIRQRRGRNVDIRVPAFVDEASVDPPVIHMDSMLFGMGLCCEQVTLQAMDLDEGRVIHDLFVVLAPLFMPLTASTPIYRGRLADVDCRWNIISASVDDRTEAEMVRPDEAAGPVARDPPSSKTTTTTHTTTQNVGDALVVTTTSTTTTTTTIPLGDGATRSESQFLPKSRYASASAYVSLSAQEYNDIDAPFHYPAFLTLVNAGIDKPLARHVAALFARDPLVLLSGLIEEVSDATSTLHFECLASTNWGSVRLKPPPPDSNIGWRVELRSMETGITDFENAAFAVFTILLTRALLSFNASITIPISLVDDNFDVAQRRDAVLNEAFHWRISYGAAAAAAPASVGKASLDHIFNSDLIPLLQAYIDLVGARAAGSLATPAHWIRNFVTSHPDYAKDGRVTDSIQYDLLTAVTHIADGSRHEPSLYGDLRAATAAASQ